MNPLFFSTDVNAQPHVIVGVVPVRTIRIIDAFVLSRSRRVIPIQLMISIGIQWTNADALVGIVVEKSALGTAGDARFVGYQFPLKRGASCHAFVE